MEDEIDEIWSGTDRAKERENEEGLGERDGDRQRKIERKRRERQTERQTDRVRAYGRKPVMPNIGMLLINT